MGPSIGNATASAHQEGSDLNAFNRTVTVTVPAGVEDGDKLIAFVGTNQSGGSPFPSTGWTALCQLGVDDTAQNARAPWNTVNSDGASFAQYLGVWVHDVVVAGDEPATYDFKGYLSGDKPIVLLVNVKLGDQADRFTGWTVVQNVNYESPTQINDTTYWSDTPWADFVSNFSGGGTSPATGFTHGVATIASFGTRTAGVIASQPPSPHAGDTAFTLECWSWRAQVGNDQLVDLSGDEIWLASFADGSPRASQTYYVSSDIEADFMVGYLLSLDGETVADATASLPTAESDAYAGTYDVAFSPVSSAVNPFLLGFGARVYPMFSAPPEPPPPDGGYLEIKARKVDPGVPPYRLTNRMLGRDDGSPR